MTPVTLNTQFSFPPVTSPGVGTEIGNQTAASAASFLVSSVQPSGNASGNAAFSSGSSAQSLFMTQLLGQDAAGTYGVLSHYDQLVAQGFIKYLPSNADKPAPAMASAPQFGDLSEHAPDVKPTAPRGLTADNSPGAPAGSTPAPANPLPGKAAAAYAASAGRTGARSGQSISL